MPPQPPPPPTSTAIPATNQAEYDLLMLEINERSVRFLDAKPAVRNFFMRIDSIYYERDKSPHYYTEAPLNPGPRDRRHNNGNVGGSGISNGGVDGSGGVSISNYFKNKDKNWFTRSFGRNSTTANVVKPNRNRSVMDESDDPRLYELSSPSVHNRHFAGFRANLTNTSTSNQVVPFKVTLYILVNIL